MKLVTLLIATIALLVFVPAADANTVGIPGFNCSVTAYTPYNGGPPSPQANAQGGVSCGGSQYNYSKQVEVQLWNLVSGGWQKVSDSGWSPWVTGNPAEIVSGIYPCVVGRWYASVATANVQHNGVEAGAEATSFNAGYQCP